MSCYLHIRTILAFLFQFHLWGAEKMQGLKKGPCLMAKKPEGRFLTKKGSPPEQHRPKVGLWSEWKPACTVQAEGRPQVHSSHFDVDGEELRLSWESNFHVCTEEHGLFLGWPSLSCCFICSSVFLSLSWLFTYYYFPFLLSCGDLWLNRITTIV